MKSDYNTLDQANQYFAALEPGGEFFIRQLPSGKSSHGPITPKRLARLTEINDKRQDLFTVINFGSGAKNKDISRIRAVFIDLDGVDLPEQWHLKPSLVIETSPKRYHVYWLVNQFQLYRFTATQKALATKYQSDPSVSNPARIMRVPGFKNWKYEQMFYARMLECNQLIYNENEVSQGLIFLKPPQAPEAPCLSECLMDHMDDIHTVAYCLPHIKTKNQNELFQVMVVVQRVLGARGLNIMLHWNQATHTNGQPFTEYEIRKKWNDIAEQSHGYVDINMGTLVYFYKRTLGNK